MPRQDRPCRHLVALFTATVIAFNFPVLALFDRPVFVFGVPLLVVYVYLSWAVFIALAYALSRRLTFLDFPDDRA